MQNLDRHFREFFYSRFKFKGRSDSLLNDNKNFEVLNNYIPIQNLKPPNVKQRFEGVAFSSSGEIMGSASSETNIIFLFKRKNNGLFEDHPYQSIQGSGSTLDYPHDLSFARFGDKEILAVAQRSGTIPLFEKNADNDFFQNEPAWKISGPESRLNQPDGVTFVPPHADYLAVCNLNINRIAFYRKSGKAPGFEVKPEFILKHESIMRPDGLAFSQSGKWLAVANHGNHTVSIFKQSNSRNFGSKFRYGPEPVMIIKDPCLHHPHSVAFSSLTDHLIVTNAGANYYCIYQPYQLKKWYGLVRQWTNTPVLKVKYSSDETFKEINACNKMEGGPKGVAVFKNQLAVCSPEHGIDIYSFREHTG